MRITESGIRNIVRQILLEQEADPDLAAAQARMAKLPADAPPGAGKTALLRVKNVGKIAIRVFSVTPAGASYEDIFKILNIMQSEPIDIGSGKEADISYIMPSDESQELEVTYGRWQGTGVTQGYRRDLLYDKFSPGFTGTLYLYSPMGSGSTADDAAAMTPQQIASLPRKKNELVTVVEDPTDPEFEYAVIYTISPSRAIVTRASSYDTKKGKTVVSVGAQIGPKRYGSSFQKVVDALQKKLTSSR